MYTLKVENKNGDILNLSTNPAYTVFKIDGLTPVDASLNFSELANFDGAIYNSGRLGTRNIVLYIKIHNPAEENRIGLYKYFPPKNQVRIYYKNDHRDVYIDGYVEKFECDLFSVNEFVQVSILCPLPYWIDSEKTEITFNHIESLFEFPFAISEEGIEFSRIIKDNTNYFNNSGSEIGLLIEFTAKANQILNPRFYNRTTQKYFGVNFDMNDGDIIQISTFKGNKFVKLIRKGIESNIIDKRQAGSEWLTLTPGTNELTFESDEGEINLDVKMTTYRYFEGV